MPSIVAVVPVYRRPHRVQPLLQSFTASRPDARMLFVASPEDREQLAALEGTDHLVMPGRRRPGDWAAKINHGYRNTTEPWVLCCGDDVYFHPGWDQALLETAAESGARVVGSSDMNAAADRAGVYSPHPLVARSYADQLGTVDGPGLVMCEEYDHNYPDRELAATAISRGEWAFSPAAVLEHLHPGFGKAPADSTYKLGMRNFGNDGRLFRKRSQRWQPR